jgi:hypothetical protein
MPLRMGRRRGEERPAREEQNPKPEAEAAGPPFLLVQNPDGELCIAGDTELVRAQAEASGSGRAEHDDASTPEGEQTWRSIP